MIRSAFSCDVPAMIDEHDSPHQRLAWARERAGYSAKAHFARVIGLDATTYRAYESGQNGFAKLAPKFARKLGVTAEWLLDGGPAPTTAPPEPDIMPPRNASTHETVEVQALDLSASMGTGSTIDDYIKGASVRFDLDFIRGITRTPPHRLRLAKGIGDDMYPTLLNSDDVLIDTTQTMPNLGDRIWAISLHGAAAIKRLRQSGRGKVLVISDNPAVPNQEVDAEDLIIGGRIIWFAREL